MRDFRLFCLALLSFVFLSNAHAAVIVNGSFENASVDPGNSFLELGNGSTAIDGWTVLGDGIDYVGTLWETPDGDRSVDLGRSSAPGVGGISQVIDTTPGVSYTILFDMAGNPFTPPTLKTMRVSAAGQSNDYSFDVTGRSVSDMGWTTMQFSFMADSTQATLVFEQLNAATFWGPAIDNVQIIPVPAVAWLFPAGLIAGLGWMRRRTA